MRVRCGYAGVALSSEGGDRSFRAFSADLRRTTVWAELFPQPACCRVESGIAETYSERNLRLPSCRFALVLASLGQELIAGTRGVSVQLVISELGPVQSDLIYDQSGRISSPPTKFHVKILFQLGWQDTFPRRVRRTADPSASHPSSEAAGDPGRSG